MLKQVVQEETTALKGFCALNDFLAVSHRFQNIKTMILPVVLHGCETWYFILRDPI
jgi:hypothetical protein